MPNTAVHWSTVEVMFLCTVVAGFIAFIVSLIATSTYVALGEKAAPARSVTPAVAPTDERRLAA